MKNKRKLNKIIILGLFMSILLVPSVFFVVKHFSKENTSEDLINIESLSEELVDNYLEKSKKIKEEDKENVLIIISTKNIKNTFGATNVIEAPNNQYILQYDSTEKKESALSKFNNDKSIISVEGNESYKIDTTTYNSWGVESMSLHYAAEQVNSKEVNDITVAIIDTGLDVDLANKYYSGKIAGMYNVLEESDSIMSDENGHGTHIFGTIAESTPLNVKILPVKVSTDGQMYNTDIIAAINYVTYYQKADVINMSFGSYTYSQAIEQAIEGAKEKNIISVAAAGNDNTDGNHYPSALSNTISIASVDSNLNKSNFSNYGSKITFTAPGTNIKSIMSSEAAISIDNGNNDDDDHETISGTSMATPHAVSAVAILKSFNKDLTLDNTIELLQTRAIDLGHLGWDEYYGYGLISFENVAFCDGTNCDKYNVFKKNSEISPTSIEVLYPVRTTYNYGTLNNLTSTLVRVYYSSGNYVSSTLGNLDGVEIIGYDAYDTGEQNIIIKWQGLETTFNFTNPFDWESGWTYEIIEDNNIIITGFTDFNVGNDTADVLYVPENIGEYKVVAIGKEVNNSNIGVFSSATKSCYKKIVLPDTLTEIRGNKTFAGFKNVKKIDALSGSLRITGEYVFSENINLNEITATIESLGVGTFYNNTSLKKVSLSDNITVIPNSAFLGCTNLNEINIPSSVVSIDNDAFRDNYKLNDIILPEGLITVGDRAFNNTDIENITLPKSLESIGEKSFANSNVRNLFISENLNSIGAEAFGGCGSLESIVVDEKNSVYDSRENSNALIDTRNNLILRGTNNTQIPISVTGIGASAFSYDLRIEEFKIPDQITFIGKKAFYECNYLINIEIPRTVQTIENQALSTTPIERQGSGKIPLTVLTYTDAYAKTYAVAQKINYETLDSYFSVLPFKKEYNSFDTVNFAEDISDASMLYRTGENKDGVYREKGKIELVNHNVVIKYINGNDSFRYGDTYYTIGAMNKYGIYYETKVNVTVTKVTPSYTIPTDLKANIGQKLSEIVLPDGFEWMNPEEIIVEEGNVIFKGKYVPKDIENYKTIEYIDINVLVNNPKEIIIPNIVVTDKIYDGTMNIDLSTISISNLNSDEYSVESTVLSTFEVGETTANIKLKLSDDKFLNYKFPNGTQEQEFIVDVVIVPQKLTKPTFVGKIYEYTGEPQIIELNNFDESKMNISGNTRTDAGEQDVTISLKNDNYAWNDNSTDNVILKFKIEKASPEYTLPTGLTGNVTQRLSDIALPSGFEWMNPDEIIEESGNVVFMAKYTPEDIENYETIENIEITMNVNKKMQTVTFNSNDGKGTTSTQELEYKKITMLAENTFERDSYKFIGWNTKADGTGTSYSNKQEISITENLILYAIWEEEYSYVINRYSVDEANKYIDLIDIDTTVDAFKNNIEVNTGFTVEVDYKTVNGKNLLYTGGKTKIYKNEQLQVEYTNIIRGDVNGNATIDIIDYIRIMKDIMETTRLEGIYRKAADVNQNDKIDIIDYIRIMKMIMEEK